jgi:hypothetical protein
MTARDRSPAPPRDADDLVREALRDDLPAEVEARLESAVEGFAAERAGARGGFRASPFAYLRDAAARFGASAPGRVLLPVASSLLLVAGVVLTAAGQRNAFAESFSRMNLAVSLSEEIRRAPSMACAGWIGEEFASRNELADGIYRRFTLLGVESEPGDGTRVMFGARGETVRLEFVVEAGTLLPREIRRIERPGAAPDVAMCAWEAPRQGAGGLPPRSEP